MTVRLLTIEQKDSIINKEWAVDSYFSPIQDASGNWIITNKEYYGCTLIKAIELGIVSWFPNLPEIIYNPIIDNSPY